MLKFISKHKIFFVMLFALVLLALGSFFMFGEGNKQTENDTSAQTYSLSVSYKAMWQNDAGAVSTTGGNYVSGDGNTYSGSIGQITCTKSNSKGSFSGGGTNYTNTGAYTTLSYSVSDGSWFDSLSWSCSITLFASASSGFQVRSGSDNYWNLEGSGSINNWGGGGSDSYSWWCHFTPKQYTISYNANGGTLTGVAKNTVYYYNDYKLSSASRTGYTFAGWYTSASGGTQKTTSSVYNTTGNTTLYAHWKPNTYNVTFDKNKGSGSTTPTGGTSSTTVTYDATYPSISVPTRNGYTFNGYYTSASGGSKIYNASGTSSTKCTTASNHTLYAQWTANTYAITLNQQSGSGGTGSFYYKFDTNAYYSNASCTTSLSSITIPTRTGYTFGGYYTGTNGTGTQYVNASGGFTNSPFKNIYSNTTLYAKWTENDYTIKFDKNGGAGTMSSVSGVLYTANQTLPSNTYYRYGYLFKGWATSAVAVDGAVVYKENETVTKLSSTDGEIVTLYAVWEKTWAVDKTTPSGSGTSASPYLIANAQNLAWLAWQCETQNLSGYFKQIANISLSGETWLPIGDATYKFLGSYDGNNYVITNLTTTTTTKANGDYLYSYQGLFGYTNNATIDNVKVFSGTIRGYNYVGGIAGQSASTTIKNSQVGSVSVYADSSYNGGIVGYATSSTLTANYSKAQMTGDSYYGGIMGYSASSTFTACAFEGTLGSTTYGYSVGYGSSTATKLNDCFAKTTTSNGFIRGSKTTNSCLYIAGSAKRYYSGTFTNWVITTTATPLPQGLSWLATGGTKVTSVSQITALGYTAA